MKTLSRRFAVSLLVILMPLMLFVLPAARADSLLEASPFGAWVVTEAAAEADVGLYFYFSPDGTFLMVDPRRQTGAAGSFVLGRAGLLVNLYTQGASSMFLIGDVRVTGDRMTIDNRQGAILPPQRVTLRRLVLR